MFRNNPHVSSLCVPHHICLHLHKSSTEPGLLACSSQQSAVTCSTQHVNYICSTVIRSQWKVSHWPNTVLYYSFGKLLVCGLFWVHFMNSTVTVLYKVSKEIVTALKTILLNKLVCTANYKCRCLLNVAIPVKFVACYIPLYPQSLTLISNTQQINQKISQFWCPSHWQTLRLCPHCSYCSSQSYIRTEIWDFLIQNLALIQWVKQTQSSYCTAVKKGSVEEAHTNWLLS
jgi:hypothetical protein